MQMLAEAGKDYSPRNGGIKTPASGSLLANLILAFNQDKVISLKNPLIIETHFITNLRQN